MRSILISIKPQWVAKILNGEKTLEIRKTAPKCELPVDVYIYCTKNKLHYSVGALMLNRDDCFKRSVDGTYKYGDSVELMGYYPEYPYDKNNFLNGKVCAKFTLKAVHKFDWRLVANPFFKVRGSCLGYDQLRKYATDKKGIVHDLYGWCISDLEIFDKPKELWEFYGTPKKINGLYGAEMVNISLSNPPQSWCFIEVD